MQCCLSVKTDMGTGADPRFSKGGASTSGEGASFLGGLGACPPPENFENLSL